MFRLFTAPARLFIHQTSKLPGTICFLIRFLLIGFFYGMLLLLLGAAFFFIQAASYDMKKIAEMPARTVVIDRKGKTIGHMHGDNRLLAKYNNVSDWFIKALIAREDERFYQHRGVDFRGLARGVYVAFKGRREGGSTLSMQLAENTFDYNGKSIYGKFLELALATRIENNYTKKEILEHYMNRIFWGGSIRGIESASQTYFEKPASELTLSESAMLAGIISAPNAFNPFRHLDRAIKKRDITLRTMQRLKFITEDQMIEAMNEKIHIRPKNRRLSKKSYAMETIDDELRRILEKKNIKKGGLTVTTTLDLDLQKHASRCLNEHLSKVETYPAYIRKHQTRSQYEQTAINQRQDPQYLQGSLVCLENRTGAIIAILGGRDPNHSELNRAHCYRQIASVFKPFVYLSAFDRGMHPGGYVSDARIRQNEIANAPASWTPDNADGRYYSTVTAQTALIQSRNTSSLRVGNYAGLDRVIDLAKRIGFSRPIERNPTTFLGSFDASPIEVAKAYTIFPNEGKLYRPYLISKITDAKGKIVYEGSGSIAWTASKPGAAWLTTECLIQTPNRGTGRALRTKYNYHEQCGAKTGTSNASRNAWFAGYTSALTCVVWVGMDDNTPIYRGASGSSLALPVWAKFMKQAQKTYPAGHLRPSVQTRKVKLCGTSCQIATSGCDHAQTSYSANVPVDSIPEHSCDNHPVRAIIVE